VEYFLVSPGAGGQARNVYYWMQDGGERWIHFVKGIWKEKHEDDIVKEVVRAGDLSELDWSKTPLYDNDSVSGWLSRTGRFYGCPSHYHDKFAAFVLGIKVAELEKMGWVRVNDSRYYTCRLRPNAEQRNWLSEKGYKVYD